MIMMSFLHLKKKTKCILRKYGLLIISRGNLIGIRGHKGGKLEIPPAQKLSILSSPAAG